jgi:hypothetical protein
MESLISRQSTSMGITTTRSRALGGWRGRRSALYRRWPDPGLQASRIRHSSSRSERPRKWGMGWIQMSNVVLTGLLFIGVRWACGW